MQKSNPNNTKLADIPTYVFIDASNIRAACLKTLGIKIDFCKFMQYFKLKHAKLQDVRYYEGSSYNDLHKQRQFKRLKIIGYTTCILERKSYYKDAEYRTYFCHNCGAENRVNIFDETRTIKSNIDVYLASDLTKTTQAATHPTHIILVSCDGDYTEAIKLALTNPNIYVTVIATPPAKDFKRNTLSSRLRKLNNTLPRYRLLDITDIIDYVE